MAEYPVQFKDQPWSRLTGVGGSMFSVDKYLIPGGPFLPAYEGKTLNAMINDMTLDDSYFPGEIASTYVLDMALTQSSIIVQASRDIYKDFGLAMKYPLDVDMYLSGFYRPIKLLNSAYYSLTSGREAAITRLQKSIAISKSQADDKFVLGNLEVAETWLKVKMLSGEVVINEIVSRESKMASNLYYNLGLVAAKKTYFQYLQKIYEHFGADIAKHGHS
jgi:hypothetical protein